MSIYFSHVISPSPIWPQTAPRAGSLRSPGEKGMLSTLRSWTTLVLPASIQPAFSSLLKRPCLGWSWPFSHLKCAYLFVATQNVSYHLNNLNDWCTSLSLLLLELNTGCHTSFPRGFSIHTRVFSVSTCFGHCFKLELWGSPPTFKPSLIIMLVLDAPTCIFKRKKTFFSKLQPSALRNSSDCLFQ